MKVELIPISEIEIGERHRKDYGDIEALAQSISEHGLLQAIGITPEKELVFGERRLRAFKHLGKTEIPARIVEVDELVRAEHDENEVRKQFTPSERVAIADSVQKAIGDRQGQRTDTLVAHVPQVKTRDIAAQKAGFTSTSQFRNTKKVVDQGSLELVEAMDTGKASIRAAADLAELPKEEQSEIVAKGEAEILAAAKEIRRAKSERRRTERIEKIKEISESNTPLELVSRRYPIVYADPPWRYDYAETENRAIENQYPTMTLDDICAMPLKEITTPDALLFLWTTSPKLEESFRVIREWGFEYKTCMVWDKEKIGMGYYARQQHELLLIAKKGSIPAPEPADRPSSVIRFPRGKHSSKPEVFHEIIEKMYPNLPKIELFSRREREGWDAWGNQAA